MNCDAFPRMTCRASAAEKLKERSELQSLISVVLLSLLGWGIWQACQPRYAFVIQLERGRPRVARGYVTKAFLNEVRELCHFHGVARGAVRGRRRGAQIALEVSGPFSPECRQQLRNLWGISGWPATRGRGRPGLGRDEA